MQTNSELHLAQPIVALSGDRGRSLSPQSLTAPLHMAIHARQTRLILDDIIESARATLVEASQIVANRGIASDDAFLRYHLSAAAFEIARLSKNIEGFITRFDTEPPCLVRALDFELSRVSRDFSGSSMMISREVSMLGIVPTLSSALIFGRLARVVLDDAAKNLFGKKSLLVRLKRSAEMLRFTVDGPGSCDEAALMHRIPAPARFRSLLSTLSGRISATPNGISLHIPLIACTNFEAHEVMGFAAPIES